MDFDYLLLILAAAISAVAVYAILKYRCARIILAEKEKIIQMQLGEIEDQGKFVKNLSRLYDSMSEYDKNKTDFFSNIIHELKTPISVILSAIQLVETKMPVQGTEDGGLMRNYRIIRQNCYRLLRLVNNLLDFARLDSGYLKLNPANCNLAFFTEEITQSVVPFARMKDINIVFDTQSEEIFTAFDIEKLERVLLNLLSNAIKFTGPSGTVCVSTYLSGEKACISVKDTGIGIPPEKREEIFKRFQQVGSELSKPNEGSGIGLSIVKSFVEMHQGSIKINSDVGKGTEFIIELPLRRLEKENESTPEDIRFKLAEAANIEFSTVNTGV